MKTLNSSHRNVARSRRWFRRPRRRHDAMLVLNMSIFNCGRGWNHFITPFPERENVWST